MNRNKWFLAATVVLMVVSAAALIGKFKSMQRLGPPGVATRPLAGGLPGNLEVLLPENVLDYKSELIPVQAVVTNMLPPDTSYGQRMYHAPDKFGAQVNVVLMGADRTSHHKPQYCLTGGGWSIIKTEADKLPMTKPAPYELSVIKLTAAQILSMEGKPVDARGVYVYWFVADGALSADPTGKDRMWSMAKGLITTGVMQRWAYVSYFAMCAPGDEDATYDRLKKLIVASVPEFQTTPTAAPTSVAGNP